MSGPTLARAQERFAARADAASRSIEPFWDGRYEYRRLLAEVFGTFLLVFVAAGGGVIGALSVGGEISLLMKVLAPGFVIVAIVYFMGTVSGAHINPAVTVAFALRRQFPWVRVPGYIGAQLLGATLAALILQILYGGIQNGRTIPGVGIDPLVALLTEVLLTMGLIVVVLGVTDGPRNVGTNAALAFGLYVALAGMIGAVVSGASMNPARTLGPDLVAFDFADTWIYLVGPVVGAVVAIIVDRLIHGPPDAVGASAAQGLLSADDPRAL